MPSLVQRLQAEPASGIRRAENFIGGQWHWPDVAGEIRSLNPADTRQTVCIAPDSPKSDLDRAVRAANDCLSPSSRCKLMTARPITPGGIP